MPVTFEEVTAEVAPEPKAREGTASPAAAARTEDVPEQWDRERRLREERQARLDAD